MGVTTGVAVFVLSAWLLLSLISSFRRTWRDAEILRAPALPRQTLRFPVAGEMALYLEGPRFRTWSRRCHYSCVETATAVAVPIVPTWSGSGVRSRHYSRVQHGNLILPRTGDYRFDVAGLQPAEAPEYAVVFMRRLAGRLLRFILLCVLLGMLLIGSVVLTVLSAVL